MTARNASFALFAVLFFCACTAVRAQETPAAWTGFNAIALTFAEGRSPGTTWSGAFDEQRHDFLLDVQLREPEPMRGKVGLVGGRVMIVTGLELRPGAEIDAMDGPILSMRLAMAVLGRLFPDGPRSVLGLQKVDRGDEVGIEFATPSARGAIGAPWTVTGSVENYNAGAVNFDLTLTVPSKTAPKPATGTIHLVGRLAMRTQPALADDMPLDGWSIYTLGPLVVPGAGSRFGARPSPKADVKTVGDVRRALAQMR